MVTITADQIISILQGGTYPVVLHYFKYKQKFPIYVSVEILRSQPDSYVEDVLKTERNFIYEIRVLHRYLMQPNVDSSNQSAIEDEMSRVLKAYDFQGKGKIFLETIGWTRSDLTDNNRNIYGSMSVVRLGVKDITSTDGNGYVGAYNTMELNSDTTPTTFQIINSSFKSGRGIVMHADDFGLMVGDPTNNNPGDLSVTYENTATLAPLIQSLSQAGVTIKCRFINGSTIYKYILLVGETVTSGGYSDVERATTRFVVNGTWT